jgi:hypothetical protein
MDKVTQSNAASAEETASASEELNAQAASLKNVVEELRALVGGHTPVEGAIVRAPAPRLETPALGGNGRRATPALSRPAVRQSHSHGGTNGRSHGREIPMPAPRGIDLVQDSDFRDF